MIKVMTWFSRKPGMSLDEFRRYWRHEHPRAVLKMPGLRAYNQNPTTDAGYAKGDPFCDGVAETWWDDLDTLRAHRGTPELEALMADEAQFIDPDRRHHLVVDEVVITDASPGPDAVKQITWIKRRPDLTPEQAHDHWRRVHGPLGASVPGMVRYVQNHAAPHLYRDGREPEFDGAAMAYLENLEMARVAARSDELAATRADEANFIAPGPLPWVIATEIKIL
jgi:uncharacterized protein (TIGR02118 family)